MRNIPSTFLVQTNVALAVMKESRLALFLIYLLGVFGEETFGDVPLKNVPTNLKVAVIGAGISGGCTANFLKQLLGSNVHISVYEKESRIGGRLRTVNVDGVDAELGGAVYHHVNSLVRGVAKRNNLTEYDPFPDALLGIWDGDQFVFQEKLGVFGNSLNLMRALWKYGISSKTANDRKDLLIEKFLRIYSTLDAGG
jgi:monoamine oxidase